MGGRGGELSVGALCLRSLPEELLGREASQRNQAPVRELSSLTVCEVFVTDWKP